jgi:hypothetical protein
MCTPETFTGAATEERGVHRAGSAAVHALPVLVPEVDALGARVALDHPLGIVVRVVRERFDRDEIARLDLDRRFQRLAEVAPVHRVRGGRYVEV